MAIQKYRADSAGVKQSNGAIPWFTTWLGGPSLALIRNCPTNMGPRTVYIKGEPDSMWSIPAACRYKGKTITGYITSNDAGEYVFKQHINQ